MTTYLAGAVRAPAATPETRVTANLPTLYQPNVIAAQMEYAKALSHSNLLPRQYQGNPANLLWAISYGQTLGVDPMTAVQSIHVINGKPTASADLIAGLVRRAGHKLRISGDGKRAVAQIVRADDPDFTFESVWTIERAEAAKLTGKDTWKQFPAAMLRARSITEVARAACSEILQGTIYTPEELGAYVDQDGNPVDAPVQPLRAVQTEPASDGVLTIDPDCLVSRPEALAIAQTAAKATTLDDWRVSWKQADAAGLLNAAIEWPVGSGHFEMLRNTLTRRGNELKRPPTATEDVVDAEVVEPGFDERTVAVDELRAAALAAGVAATIEDDFAESYGVPVSEATVEQLHEMASMLRGAA